MSAFPSLRLHFNGLSLAHPPLSYPLSNQCLRCGPDQRTLFEIKNSLQTKANKHEQFFTELDKAPDGFAKVAEYFGKAVFSKEEPQGGDGPGGRVATRRSRGDSTSFGRSGSSFDMGGR